jgi:hypothetical protein
LLDTSGTTSWQQFLVQISTPKPGSKIGFEKAKLEATRAEETAKSEMRASRIHIAKTPFLLML